MSPSADLASRGILLVMLLAFGLFLWDWPVWQVAVLGVLSLTIGIVAHRTRFVVPTWAGAGLTLAFLIASLVAVGIALL